jgi:hypothetical protein
MVEEYFSRSWPACDLEEPQYALGNDNFLSVKLNVFATPTDQSHSSDSKKQIHSMLIKIDLTLYALFGWEKSILCEEYVFELPWTSTQWSSTIWTFYFTRPVQHQ